MRKIAYFVAMLVLFYLQLMAEGIKNHPYELFIGTVNVPDGYSTTIKVQKIGISWDDSFDITDGYNGHTFSFNGSSIEYGNIYDDWQDGFDFVTSIQGDHGGQYGGVVTYGVYKIQTTYAGQSIYFKLDYRDCRYVGSGQQPYSSLIDIFIIFDGQSLSFKYSADEAHWPFNNINNKSTIGVWEMFNVGSPVRSCFEPTPPQNFHFDSTRYPHPHFTWLKPSQPTGVTFKYNIYQSVDAGPYYRVASNLTASSWTDNDVILHHGGNRFSYYATAFGSQSPESDPSKFAPIQGNPSKQLPSDPENRELKKEGELSIFSVYPNPFNPETQINYNLPRESRVTLSVYNIAGQKVAILITERQSAGTHTAIFDGKSLPAGVYLVNLQVGRENHLQKVLLVK
ncbi:MAG: T9SS type A sorting domain-containing protein [Calditrichaeota bacterium]|nr:T9SS type A sorting domain-containing protein [Calditrichota bacterium]